MGAVNFSIDDRILDILSRNLPLDLFIETGTFEGDSTDRARHYFREIYSIELSVEYHKKATDRFNTHENIHIVHGNSDTILKQLHPIFQNRSSVFWLDAHWCVAENTAGETSQCHLLEEIEAIGRLNDNSVLLIDDARFFLAPPPYPHIFRQWPDFSGILKKLEMLSDQHAFRVINDVILFFPRRLITVMDEYGYHHGVDWNHIHQKACALDECETDRADRLTVINNLNKLVAELEIKLKNTRLSSHTKNPLHRPEKKIFGKLKSFLQKTL